MPPHHHTTHTTGQVEEGPPKIKVPYSRNPVFVAEGYKPPVVTGRIFEYETSTENAAFWRTLSLAYRHFLKKEADTRRIDLRLLIDERRAGAFRCHACGKPTVMRELFANSDRVYQCLNSSCVRRIIRFHYNSATGRIAEVS